jgi:hypothetical protein
MLDGQVFERMTQVAITAVKRGFYNTSENLFRGGWLYSLTVLLIGLSFQAI